MTHAYQLMEGKMSMKARKEKHIEKENDKMVSFRNLLLCVSFLRVPVSSQVMPYSCHVVHG